MTKLRLLALLGIVGCGGGDADMGRPPTSAEVTALCERYCPRAANCGAFDPNACATVCPDQFPRFRADLLEDLVTCVEDTACELFATCEDAVLVDLVWTDTAHAVVAECRTAAMRCVDEVLGINCDADDTGVYNDPTLEVVRACLMWPCAEIRDCVNATGV